MKDQEKKPNVKVEFVDHFKTEEKAKRYIDDLIDEGYACNLFTTPLGYFVCALTVKESE